jgi:PAS domain S-box-containing protein
MTEPVSKLDAADAEWQLISLLDDLVNVMFCAKARDGRYRAVNTAFVRRSGRTSKRDVLGQRASDLFPGELATRYEEQDARVMGNDEVLHDELELIRRPDSSTGWYLTAKRPIHDGTGAVVGLVSVSRDLLTPDERGISVESLEPIVAAVRRGFESPPTAVELSELAGCSPAQLDRRMKKVFGLTTAQFLLKTRIDRAAELLRRTTDSVASVAAATGFYDQAAFTKQFVRLLGETPTQFRTHPG